MRVLDSSHYFLKDSLRSIKQTQPLTNLKNTPLPMILQGINRLFVTAFFLFAFVSLSAQGWERAYGFSAVDQAAEVIQLPDGGFVFAGSQIREDVSESKLEDETQFNHQLTELHFKRTC